MNGVDIANQMRSNYETHRKALRNWWPLFYWILDTAIVNAFCISKLWRKEAGLPALSHHSFRTAIFTELLQSAFKKESALLGKRARDLPDPVEDHQHKPLRITRQSCDWCKCQYNKAKQQGQALPKQVPKTYFSCKTCKVPLCKPGTRSCWADYHQPRVPLGERDRNRM